MTTQEHQATHKPRIALYGGAFDPVHRAHLEVARAARRQASLDRVAFIPAAQSPLKAHSPVASDAARLKMLELALAGEAGFVIDDSELKRGGVSYTVDTVQAFKARMPDADLYWIIGGDQLEQLDRWHAIRELAQAVTFLVLARPGYQLSAPGVSGLKYETIDAPLMEESSTSIRERIVNGESVIGLLPQSVEAFIREEGLYT
ncbi:nicotinate (nicotinamide) nucleotide adenylyltransferase [Coraliomargarita sinensis]|uniref:Probable nicotinate-nucleotide adenylyltransferase n=1 Tax=Coraliomargarita sinensis TaxID=2174842 RepID=A0A317ZIB4_9BACT|nr:nicotinate-nucleotide adenylyltransferase [Coraliomargarita sinensis]PXA03953.1 nicotinate (nicotinamide) nucleotide adenylyltransferase [Coraliomargarita sinensis]